MLSFRPPWMAQPYSLLGRRPGPAAAIAALAAARLRAFAVVLAVRPVSEVTPGVRPAAVAASGERKPEPAVLLPNAVRKPPGNATLPFAAKLPPTTVFGSNWPTWISCTAPDSWAEPQGWSSRRAATKSGMPL